MTVKTVIPFSFLVAALVSGCGGQSEPKAAPDLRGERLDVAERRLDELGLEFERVGGGTFGIVVRSNWEVCKQEPAPGVTTRKLRLIVDRYCPPPAPVARVAPHLVGQSLRLAERRLQALDVSFSVESLDLSPPAPSLTKVCDQSPLAGTRTSRVTLFVARNCAAPAPRPSPPRPAVPDLVGLPLDDAELHLDGKGIGWSVVPSGPGPVVDSLWEVCRQMPPPGSRAWHVRLFARDDCD